MRGKVFKNNWNGFCRAKSISTRGADRPFRNIEIFIFVADAFTVDSNRQTFWKVHQ